ncbi:uncharacterized protein ARMOST_20630 [Armillaria ostoyae]|uniref:Uncharacterized protein n=1 Tax=Armillaria ostoyae TaxID=47428 RepID=A0A284S7V8_ARMOS|nr:uncharacterized protein ARMOST_20630 [Armillaria ostoyae]
MGKDPALNMGPLTPGGDLRRQGRLSVQRSTVHDNPPPRNSILALAWGLLGLFVVVTIFRSWLRRRITAFKSNVGPEGISPMEEPESRDMIMIIEDEPYHCGSD